MPHRLSRAAVLDLKRIYRASTLRFGIAHADRYLDEIEAAFLQISRFPETGVLRDDLRGVRMIRRRSLHIYYRSEVDYVLIVRVLHGRQDSKRYL